MTEVEAKFLVERSVQLSQLIDAFRSSQLELTPVSNIDIVDRYFDTPGWKLLQRGWTFRWRDASGKRQLALKSIGTTHGAVHRREELEQEVQAFPVKGECLPTGPVAEQLAKLRQEKLRELFRVDNQRELFHVRTSEGALVEVALDHAKVTLSASAANCAPKPIEFAELELELKDGAEDALQRLAAKLPQRLDLLPARLSKFERSLRPLGLRPPIRLSTETLRPGESTFLRKLRQCPLRKKDPVVNLAYNSLQNQFETMLAEEPIAWEGLDMEGVHQMRVAIRRIRAALQAFKLVLESNSRSEFRREFKWLAGVLGSVRDLDVYQDNFRCYMDEIPGEDALCLNVYRQHLIDQWKTARKKMVECLSGERYRKLKSSFAEFLQRGPSKDATTIRQVRIRDAAARLIGKQYQVVLRVGRSITADSPSAELHALRIDCKRLRYLFEFFRATYGKSLIPFIKPLKSLQDVLGELHDADFAVTQLRQYADRVPMQDENRGQLLALGQLIAGQRGHAKDRRIRFYKVWKRFDRRCARKRILQVLR